MSSTAYDFSFRSIKGEDMINLSDFKGKVMVVVNTASRCGFTNQYRGLQALHVANEDLVVIGVPSNDFGNQEPASNEEIRTFCDKRFRISFPLAEKSVVKGKDAHPFYKWAREELGFHLRGPPLEFPQDPDRQEGACGHSLRRIDHARFEKVQEEDRKPSETLA